MGVAATPPCKSIGFAPFVLCALVVLFLSCVCCDALRATRAASLVKHSVSSRKELQADRSTSDLLAFLEAQEEPQEQNVALLDLEERPDGDSEDDASLVETRSRQVASLDGDDEDTERPLGSARDLERAKGLKKMPKKKKIPIWMRKHRRRKIPATKPKDPYVRTTSHAVAEDDNDDEDESHAEGDHDDGLSAVQPHAADVADRDADDALYQSELLDQQQQDQASSGASTSSGTGEDEGDDRSTLSNHSREPEPEQLDTSTAADDDDTDSQTEWSDPQDVAEVDPSS